MKDDENNGGLFAVALILLFVLGLALGCVLGSQYTNLNWRIKLVDDPEDVAAIRSAILADRNAAASWEKTSGGK